MAPAPASGFAALVADSLGPLGGVTVRRMFGGYGVFKDGLMFGLIADDVLYLRVDDGNRSAFETEGLEPFVYDQRGRPVEMPYRRAPEAGLDDPEILCDWASGALAAARRQDRKHRKSPR